MVSPAVLKALEHVLTSLDYTFRLAGLERGVAVIMLMLYACHCWCYCTKVVADGVQPSSGKIVRQAGAPKSGAKVTTGAPALVLKHSSNLRQYPMRPFEAFSVGVAAVFAMTWLNMLMIDSLAAITDSSHVPKALVAFTVMPLVLGLLENIARAFILGKQHIGWTVEGVVVFNIRLIWFVLQLAVVIGWCKGAKTMGFLFDPVHIIVLVMPVAMINWILQGYGDKW